MRKIIILLILVFYFSCKSNLNKSKKDIANVEYSKNRTQPKENIKTEEDSLKKVLRKISLTSTLDTEENSNVLKDFPKVWQMSSYSSKDKKSKKSKSEILFEQISNTISNNYYDKKGKEIVVNKFLLSKMLKTEQVRNLLSDDVVVYVSKIPCTNYSETFSLVFCGELKCKCEYGKFICSKYLLTLNSNLTINDTFVLSSEIGNDINRDYEIGFYNDNNITKKFFNMDELETRFKKTAKYKISKAGKFEEKK